MGGAEMIEIRRLAGTKHGMGENAVDTSNQLIVAVDAPTLVGADLSERRLEFANLHGQALANINLTRSILTGADLSDCDLSNAVLFDTDLTGCDLSRANFQGADLRYALLVWAKLHGADLREAQLANVRLREARFDASTRWPKDFDPVAARAILEPEPSPSG
jgi:uncharacterized protein YjbI with pentapeptide repeats